MIERLTEVAQNDLIQYQWRKDIAAILASHDKLVKAGTKFLCAYDKSVDGNYMGRADYDLRALLKEIGQ